MKSKRSFFSKTFFLKNITRYWPIWTAYLLYLLYRLPLLLYVSLDPEFMDVTDPALYRIQLMEDLAYAALQPFPIFFFACISAIAVFSYLFQARNTNMIHSLPVCRESLFITNILSGSCFLIIPQIITFLVSIIVCFLLRLTHLEYLLHWLILSCGMAIFAFALAVLMVMVTGNIFAVPIFFLLINYIFVICRTILGTFIEKLCYGIPYTTLSFGDFLSPLYYLSNLFGGVISSLLSYYFERFPLELSHAYVCIGGYFILGLILLILAYLVYRKKHLETVGDVITLPLLNPLFRWLSAICLGSGIAIWGHSLLAGDNIITNSILICILMVIGTIVFFFLTEMILKKDFKVFSKKRCLESGILAVLCLLVLIGIEMDLLGTEKKIPQEQEIDSIFLSCNYPVDVDQEDFSQVLTFHQQLINKKDEFEGYFNEYNYEADFTSVDIVYTLKNGKTLSRLYWIPLDEYYLEQTDYCYHQLNDLCNNPEYFLQYHFSNAYDNITFVDGYLDLHKGNDNWEYITFSQSQCNTLYQAFKQDIIEGNYLPADSNLYEKNSSQYYYNTLSFTYDVPIGTPIVTYSGTETIQGDNTLHSTDITLSIDCVHTLQALRDMGILTNNDELLTQKDADIMFNTLYAE